MIPERHADIEIAEGHAVIKIMDGQSYVSRELMDKVGLAFLSKFNGGGTVQVAETVPDTGSAWHNPYARGGNE